MKALMSFVKVEFLGSISPNEVFAWLDPICNVGVKSSIYVVEMVANLMSHQDVAEC